MTYFLFEKYTKQKNGAPIKAVMAPTGNSAGEITVLAIRSVKIKNKAPKIPLRGITMA
jgi:hypothetical protein